MAKNKKPKHEAIGQIRYYWDTALFVRQFEMEVDAPPEMVADYLGFGIWRDHTAKFEADSEKKSYKFHIQILNRHRGLSLTSVDAMGRIFYSEGYDKTIVQGNMLPGTLQVILLSGQILIASIWSIQIMRNVLGLANDMQQPFFLLLNAFVWIGLCSYGLWRIKEDHLFLANHIREKLNDAQQAYIANDYYESVQE